MDVRVLAASNRPLKHSISEGRLREDLLYRLKVFTIELPPLHERIEDLPLLVAEFIRQANQETTRKVESVRADCLEALRRHRWPGNVRELRSAILHAITMSKGRTISLEDLPPHLRSSNGKVKHVTFPVGSRLDEVERELIGRTIEFAAGNKTLAAGMLGLGLRTLYRRLERYAVSETPGAVNGLVSRRTGWRA